MPPKKSRKIVLVEYNMDVCFLKDFNYLFVCVVCALTCAYAHVCRCLRGLEEGIRCPEIVVTSCCQSPIMCAGNRTHGRQRSRQAQQLIHPSSVGYNHLKMCCLGSAVAGLVNSSKFLLQLHGNVAKGKTKQI